MLGRIKIKDIPLDRKIAEKDLKRIMGGGYWSVIEMIAAKSGGVPTLSLYRSKAEAGQSDHGLVTVSSAVSVLASVTPVINL